MTADEPELELLGAKTGSCIRAAMDLSEAGLNFRVRSVNLRGGERRSAELLALNPAAEMPVLVMRDTPDAPGHVLSQSNAILFYAAHRAPNRLLPPSPSTEFVRVIEAYSYFVSDVIAVSGVALSLQSSRREASRALSYGYLEIIAASERYLNHAGIMGR